MYGDRSGLLVLALGGTVGSGAGAAGSISSGYIIDSSGNFGTYVTIGYGGASSGAYGGITAAILGATSTSSNTTISDYSGFFVGGGASASGEYYIAGEGFYNPANPTQFGGAFTGGIGLPGIGGSGGGSYTYVCPTGNVNNLYQSFLDSTITLIQIFGDAYDN